MPDLTLDQVEVTATPVARRGAPPPPDTEELVVVTGGMRLAGWTRIRLTAGVEIFPRHFEIETTERYPGQAAKAIVTPRAPCQVYIRNARYQDKLLDGYIDRYIVQLAKGEHRVRLIGRSKCEDLVDSALNAFQIGWVIHATSIKQVAELICKPFGIDVVVLGGDVDIPAPLQQFAYHPGYTCYGVLEEFCRSVGRLLYDDEDGNLVIANVSDVRAGSAIQEGQNAERYDATISTDQRFAAYYVLGQNRTESLFDNVLATAKDPQSSILGQRLRIIPAEAPDINLQFSLQRAVWEANRRFGRAMQARVTLTGWRDGQGQLWKPNTIVNVQLPSAKISEDRCISEVTYQRGEEGTQAVVTLMPSKALDVQPFTVHAPL